MNTMTAEQVREAALNYNASYPEAAAEIASGSPELAVTYSMDASGWKITARAGYIVRGSDGAAIFAQDPAMLAVGQRLPRWAVRDSGRMIDWLVRKSYPANELPVSVERR